MADVRARRNLTSAKDTAELMRQLSED
jgi:hypothetical protein